MARLIVDIKFRGDDSSERIDQFNAVFALVNKALAVARQRGKYDEVLSNWELASMKPSRFERTWAKEIAARDKHKAKK